MNVKDKERETMEYVNIPFEDRSARWPVIKTVGSGRHGTTYLVRDPVTGDTRIMKKLQFIFTDTQASSYDEYAHEVETHVNVSRLFPDYVPKLYDYWVCDNTGYIVMEYFAHGEHPPMTSLAQFDNLCRIWKEIASRGYYHGDFKTPNIFCRGPNGCEPVIGDWGIAVFLPAFTTEAMNACLSEQMDMLSQRKTFNAIYLLLIDVFKGAGEDRRPLVAKMLEFEMMYRLHYGLTPELKLECGTRIKQEIVQWVEQMAPDWEINATNDFFDTFVIVTGWMRDNLWFQSLQAHRRQNLRSLTENFIRSDVLQNYITSDDTIRPLISQLPQAKYVNERQCLSSVRRRLQQVFMDTDKDKKQKKVKVL